MKEFNTIQKITVLTLCYNNAPKVLTALNSISKQTYTNIEHIILDDSSTDNSVEIIQKWIQENNYNCLFLKNETNIGICKSLNKALTYCSGELIANNSDDWWDKDHLYKNIKLLQDNNADVIYSNVKVVDEDRKLLFYCHDILKEHGYSIENLLKDSPELAKTLDNKKAINALFYANYLHPISLITYTNILKDLGGYDEALPFEDYDMNFRLCSRNYSILYNMDSTVEYIKYKTAYTSNPAKRLPMLQGIIMTLSKHKQLLKNPDTIRRYNETIFSCVENIIVSRPFGLLKYTKLYFRSSTNVSRFVFFRFFKSAFLSKISSLRISTGRIAAAK